MQQNQQSERKPLILSVQHLEVLENFISEIPTKYGVTLLNFFAEVSKEQVEEEVIETTEE
jgi:hypothetical protein